MSISSELPIDPSPPLLIFHSDISSESYNRYPIPYDSENDEPVDDWGYAECERNAFLAGALWVLGAE